MLLKSQWDLNLCLNAALKRNFPEEVIFWNMACKCSEKQQSVFVFLFHEPQIDYKNTDF